MARMHSVAVLAAGLIMTAVAGAQSPGPENPALDDDLKHAHDQGVVIGGLMFDGKSREEGRPVPGANKVFQRQTSGTRKEIVVIIVPQIVGSTPHKIAGKPVAPPVPVPATAAATPGQNSDSSLMTDAVQELAAAARHLAAAQARINEQERQLRTAQVRARPADVKGRPSPQLNGPLVVLQAKVMELQVSKLKEIGLDLQLPDVKVCDSPDALDRLTALRKDVLKVLAEPTLAVVSGREATFQSGGEFPIVVPQSTGTMAIEYRHYGTRLDVVPQVMPDGRIRLELEPTISEIDDSSGSSVTVAGHKVPRLKVRKMSTAVEMKPGQTVLLSQPKQTPGEDGQQTVLILAVTANVGAPAKRAEAPFPHFKR